MGRFNLVVCWCSRAAVNRRDQGSRPTCSRAGGGYPGGVEQYLAEAAHVLVHQLMAAVEGKGEVDVGQGRAGAGLIEQASGHAQVDQQRLALIQVHQEIFPPAAQAGDRRPIKDSSSPGSDCRRRRLIALADPHDRLTHQLCGQPPAYHLHLRKFRHN